MPHWMKACEEWSKRMADNTTGSKWARGSLQHPEKAARDANLNVIGLAGLLNGPEWV